MLARRTGRAPHGFSADRPRPPRLSEHLDGLKRIEASGQFSNNGPEVRALEAEMVDRLFDGRGCAGGGQCDAGADDRHPAGGGHDAEARHAGDDARHDLAATAQAAIWAGLTPLIVDVDPQSWTADPARRSDARAPWRPDRAIVPYATFGTDIDLDRYAWLARRHGVGVVVDAAASLGTLDERGRVRYGGALHAGLFDARDQDLFGRGGWSIAAMTASTSCARW
jgi:hypothetical protein